MNWSQYRSAEMCEVVYLYLLTTIGYHTLYVCTPSSESDSDVESSDDDSETGKRTYSIHSQQNLVGRVLCVDFEERSRRSVNVPVLVVLPSADDVVLPSRQQVLVKSFKDGKLWVNYETKNSCFYRQPPIHLCSHSLVSTSNRKSISPYLPSLPTFSAHPYLPLLSPSLPLIIHLPSICPLVPTTQHQLSLILSKSTVRISFIFDYSLNSWTNLNTHVNYKFL